MPDYEPGDVCCEKGPPQLDATIAVDFEGPPAGPEHAVFVRHRIGDCKVGNLPLAAQKRSRDRVDLLKSLGVLSQL